MWRCVNNIVGYCKDTPDFDKQTTQIRLTDGVEGFLTGGHCKLDYKTCGKFSVLSQTVPNTPIEAHCTPTKIQPKKAVKKQAPVQGSLF